MKDRKQLKAIGWLAVAAVMLLITWWLTSCADDGCRSGSTRCHDNRVELCDHEDNDGDSSDGDWGMVLNCDEYAWICCGGYPINDEDEHGCVPAPSCEAWFADGGVEL